MSFVLDASVALGWAFEDEASDMSRAALRALRTRNAAVPGIWPYEVANVLVMAGRRGRLSPAAAAEFTHLLAELPIEIEAVNSAAIWDAVPALAREYGLTAYDAAYLELAMRHGAELATADRALSAAAASAGVRLFGAAA